jgi:hypothetical protein
MYTIVILNDIFLRLIFFVINIKSWSVIISVQVTFFLTIFNQDSVQFLQELFNRKRGNHRSDLFADPVQDADQRFKKSSIIIQRN